MRILNRLVVDTNLFASTIMFPRSAPRQVVDDALEQGVVLFSEATMSELTEVLSRSKFDRYVSRRERELVLAQIGSTAEFVPILRLVRECRDPKDDKFLEVALNGRANGIITGDADLLALNPWREIAILSPSGYLNASGAT
ncbi:MAG: putative toxin-antitoxin system toxin component, PIN family [Candidatus Sulfotelmatobacter sp.]